jgi:Zn-dependent alcohol dehydrogenase
MVEINRNEQLTIGTDASIVSIEKNNNNVLRNSIILINTSTGGQVITIAIDSPAVSNQGITLNAGGSWQDSAEGGYLPTQKQITAISSAADGKLSIQERAIKRAL